MHFVVLALGSNKAFVCNNTIMSPPEVLKQACDVLCSFIPDLQCSSLYQTQPMYVTDQADFFNMAVCGMYNGSPENLLSQTQHLEKTFGRNRDYEIPNGPRTLDIDIILFSDIVMSSDSLVIPHPRIEERAFVLAPMLEILPKDADNSLREYYSECLQKVGFDGIVKNIP